MSKINNKEDDLKTLIIKDLPGPDYAPKGLEVKCWMWFWHLIVNDFPPYTTFNTQTGTHSILPLPRIEEEFDIYLYMESQNVHIRDLGVFLGNLSQKIWSILRAKGGNLSYKDIIGRKEWKNCLLRRVGAYKNLKVLQLITTFNFKKNSRSFTLSGPLVS